MRTILDLVFAPIALLCALAGRVFTTQRVGLGPRPLINNVYHAQALRHAGRQAETFVTSPAHTTSDFDHALLWPRPLGYLNAYRAYLLCVARFDVLVIGFDGGPLNWTAWLWRLEPLLLRVAGIRVVVIPYGSDVQDVLSSDNLLFKHGNGLEYPQNAERRTVIRRKVALWTKHAWHIVGGADWVHHLLRWDSLSIAPFTIDTDLWSPQGARVPGEDLANRPLRILHAPNHRELKGTRHLEAAVAELRDEGLAIDLVIAEGLANSEVANLMRTVDVVADQFVLGAYAMLSVEAMAMGRVVLVTLDPQLKRLWDYAGLIPDGGLPLIDVDWADLKSAIRALCQSPEQLQRLGAAARDYAVRTHGIEVSAVWFNGILDRAGAQS